MKLKIFIYSLLIVLFSNCGSEDDNKIFNPCETTPFPGIEGVTQSNFRLQTFTDDYETGILITSTIKNNNDEPVSGHTNFTLINNGVTQTYGTVNNVPQSCLEIEANSSCSFEMRVSISGDHPISLNSKLLCFYYSRY